ncbi:MAG: hypothetical protein ABIM42_00650 [candidate division WOR-3 bacterium]
MFSLFFISLLSTFNFVFSTEGYGELRKYGDTLRHRSAMGKIEIESEIFDLNGIRMVIYGFENIWMGRDKGLIQLDPQEADYLLGGGIKKGLGDKWVGLYLDHTCYHKVDTFVDRSLYWNKAKIVISNTSFREKFRKNFLYYRFEWGFYLRHRDVPWLTVGNPNQTDALLRLYYIIPYGNGVMPFLNASFYSGLTLEYNFTSEIELNFGLIIPGSRNDGMLYIGFRPVDRKGYREAEGAPYVGLKVKF